MKERNVLLICGIAVIAVCLAVALYAHNVSTPESDDNSSINISVNNSTEENNTTVKQTKKTTTTKKSTENTDPDYDPERDASHQGATEDNPITVEQSDGVYTYYGSGHYDYYAGDNHMSGGYYKEMNKESNL